MLLYINQPYFWRLITPELVKPYWRLLRSINIAKPNHNKQEQIVICVNSARDVLHISIYYLPTQLIAINSVRMPTNML